MGWGLAQGLGQGWMKAADIFGEIPEERRLAERQELLKAQDARDATESKDRLETNQLTRQATQQQMEQGAKTFEHQQWKAEQEKDTSRKEDLVRRFWGRPLDEASAAEVRAYNPQAVTMTKKDGVDVIELNPTFFMSPTDYADYQSKAQELEKVRLEYKILADHGDREARLRLDQIESSIRENNATAAAAATRQSADQLTYLSAKQRFEEMNRPEMRAQISAELSQDIATFDQLASQANMLEMGTANIKYGPGGSATSMETPTELSANKAATVRNHLKPQVEAISDKYARLVLQYYAEQKLPNPPSEDELKKMMRAQLMARVVGLDPNVPTGETVAERMERTAREREQARAASEGGQNPRGTPTPTQRSTTAPQYNPRGTPGAVGQYGTPGTSR